MAEDKQQVKEKEATDIQQKKGAPLWLMGVVLLVGFATVFGTMYLLMNHISQTYVVPYYKMLHAWEQRADSLETAGATVVGIPPEMITEMEAYRERSDSLTTLASAQTRQIDQLEGQVDEFEQEKLELTSQDVKQLAAIFGAMKAPRAASIMVNLDRETIIQVLMSINQRNAAKIMAAMPTDKAAGIARQIQQRAEAAGN